ncbi:hypothetical protein MHYP_G00158320 [Metynnis hypsauchen]
MLCHATEVEEETAFVQRVTLEQQFVCWRCWKRGHRARHCKEEACILRLDLLAADQAWIYVETKMLEACGEHLQLRETEGEQLNREVEADCADASCASKHGNRLKRDNVLWWCTVTHRHLRSVERYPAPDVQSWRSGTVQDRTAWKVPGGPKKAGQASPT